MFKHGAQHVKTFTAGKFVKKLSVKVIVKNITVWSKTENLEKKNIKNGGSKQNSEKKESRHTKA